MSKKLWYSLLAVLMITATALSACAPATQPPAATEPPAAGGQVEVFS